MNIGLIGLGLIGGSVAKALKKNTPHTVLGYDISEQVLYKAALLEAIDGELTEDRLPICDMVIVATRPQNAIDYVRDHACSFKKGAIVMDMCGIKEQVCEALMPLAEQNGFLFIGAHPMAGIEYSGFDYANTNLFANASIILTPPKGVGIETLDMLKKFWGAIGFSHLEITNPENHDRIIAYTSQLAHVVSSAYIKSPTAQEQYGYSAGSYKDMTRVAKLDAEMWTELFLANRKPLLHEIDTLMANLGSYRAAIAAGDAEQLTALLQEGCEKKRLADRKDLKA